MFPCPGLHTTSGVKCGPQSRQQTPALVSHHRKHVILHLIPCFHAFFLLRIYIHIYVEYRYLIIVATDKSSQVLNPRHLQGVPIKMIQSPAATVSYWIIFSGTPCICLVNQSLHSLKFQGCGGGWYCNCYARP